MNKDANEQPDFVLVLGTSLRVPRIVELIHRLEGPVIVYVNTNKTKKQQHRALFTDYVVGETDTWSKLVLEALGDAPVCPSQTGLLPSEDQYLVRCDDDGMSWKIRA